MASKEEIQIILDAQLKNSQKTIEAVKKLEKNIKGADKSIKEADKSTKFFSTTLGKLTGALGIGLLIKGVKDFTKSIVQSAGQMEQYEIAFEVMLGSAEKAKNLLKDLKEFAATTPFEFNEITKATQTMIGMGIEAEKVIDTARTLGNIAAGTGKQFGNLAYVFAEIKANARLTGNELRQLSGIPLVETIGKEIGATAQEVRKLVELGKVGFTDVEKALTSLANTKYANLMDRQNKTVLGQFSNLQDVIDETKRKLGKPLSNIVKSTTGQIIGYLEKFAVYLEENQEEIEDWVESFVDGIVVILKTLKNFGGYVSDFFNNTWAQVLAGALITWKIFANGVEMSSGKVIKLIAGMAMAMAYLSQKVEDEANRTVDGLSNLVKGFKNTAGQLKSIYDNIKNQISGGTTGNIDLNTNQTTTTNKVENNKKTGDFGDLKKALDDYRSKGDDNGEKEKEKKLRDDLLAIEQDYNIKRANSRASFREKEKEIREDAYENEKLGILDQEAFEIEIAQNELDRIKEQNNLTNQEEEEKLSRLREIKGENDALVLEMEAEQADKKLEQDIEITDKQNALDIKKEEAKYGVNIKYANLELIRKKLYDNKYFKLANSHADALVGLENNKNSKLRAVGKAAADFQKVQAIFQIGVETQKAAMSAYASLAPIPFVGPALGIAAAGLAIAYGVQRVEEVKANSFAVGSPNIEQDQLANIHKGEIIVPKTFSDGLRDGDLMLGNAKSLDNQQVDEQRGGITIINNFEGANFYGVADKD